MRNLIFGLSLHHNAIYVQAMKALARLGRYADWSEPLQKADNICNKYQTVISSWLICKMVALWYSKVSLLLTDNEGPDQP